MIKQVARFFDENTIFPSPVSGYVSAHINIKSKLG
jgi:hypothetical protein